MQAIAYHSVLEDEEIGVIVSVKEFEVKFDALLSTQDRDDTFPMARRSLFLLLLSFSNSV